MGLRIARGTSKKDEEFIYISFAALMDSNPHNTFLGDNKLNRFPQVFYLRPTLPSNYDKPAPSKVSKTNHPNFVFVNRDGSWERRLHKMRVARPNGLNARVRGFLNLRDQVRATGKVAEAGQAGEVETGAAETGGWTVKVETGEGREE